MVNLVDPIGIAIDGGYSLLIVTDYCGIYLCPFAIQGINECKIHTVRNLFMNSQ